MNFHNKLPPLNVIGVKAIPMAAKNAITHGVHPNVKSPKIKAKNGMVVDPVGSFLFIFKLICVSDNIELVNSAKIRFTPM
jgi:hypothetical protein